MPKDLFGRSCITCSPASARVPPFCRTVWELALFDRTLWGSWRVGARILPVRFCAWSVHGSSHAPVSRACAVKGGVYILGRKVISLQLPSEVSPSEATRASTRLEDIHTSLLQI